MILATTIPIDLPSGGRLEIDVDLHYVWCLSEGDDWNEPLIKEHRELDWHQVTGATWYHADGEWTAFAFCPRGFAALWLGHFLDKRFALLTEAMERELQTERV